MKQEKFIGIEAIRGLAALAVVLTHLAGSIRSNSINVPDYIALLQLGRRGVDVFFVLSGFIILFVHYDDIGRPTQLSRYLVSRFSRIVPTYWIALAVFCYFMGFPSNADLARSILLQPIGPLLPDDVHGLFYLDVTWTLQYEMIFYAVFMTLLLNKWIGRILFVSWMTWIVISNAAHIGEYLPFTGPNNFEFFAGMAAAYTLRNRKISIPRILFAVGMITFSCGLFIEGSVIYGLIAESHSAIGTMGSRIWYAIGVALVIIGIVGIERQGTTLKWLTTLKLTMLGSASYSIYLFHQPLVQQLTAHWANFGLPLVYSLIPITVFIVAACVMISRRIEYPLMKLIRRGVVLPSCFVYTTKERSVTP